MTQKLYVFLVALTCTAVIALALFAYPSADDFCFQEKAVRLGFLGAQADWYTTWSGRYTATALVSWIMLAGADWYAAALVLLALAWLVAIWLFLAACAGGAFPTRTVALASATVFAMYGAFAPGPNGAFYWASGAMTYQVAGVLLLLMLAMNIRLTRSAAKGESVGNLAAVSVASLLLGLALGGTNETVLLLAIILLAGGAIVARGMAVRAIVPWLAGFSGVAIGFAIVLLAPGNDVRWQYFPEGQDIFRSLPRAAIRTLRFIVRESANPALWLAAALTVAPIWSSLSEATRDWLIKRRGWLIILALWVAMIGASFFTAEYAFGAGPPARARNISYVVFLLGWIPVAGILAERFWSGRHLFAPSPQTKSLLLLALGLALAGGAQMREIYKELGSGPAFRKEQAQRASAIRDAAARGIKTVEVPPFTVQTQHIYDPLTVGDNGCQALASGLESVKVRK